jgi:hypothetical protein
MGRVPRAGCATRCRPYGARWWVDASVGTGVPFQHGNSPAAPARGPRPDALRRGREMGAATYSLVAVEAPGSLRPKARRPSTPCPLGCPRAHVGELN